MVDGLVVQGELNFQEAFTSYFAKVEKTNVSSGRLPLPKPVFISYFSPA